MVRRFFTAFGVVWFILCAVVVINILTSRGYRREWRFYDGHRPPLTCLNITGVN